MKESKIIEYKGFRFTLTGELIPSGHHASRWSCNIKEISAAEEVSPRVFVGWQEINKLSWGFEGVDTEALARGEAVEAIVSVFPRLDWTGFDPGAFWIAHEIAERTHRTYLFTESSIHMVVQATLDVILETYQQMVVTPPGEACPGPELLRRLTLWHLERGVSAVVRQSDDGEVTAFTFDPFESPEANCEHS